VVDPAVLIAAWPLPARAELAEQLLGRWREPHRHYHGVQHLAECLAAADELGAGVAERLALWFHDAVHTNTRGSDEAASAALAALLLADHLPAVVVDEVTRLILLTIHHQPLAGDRPGAIVCDADLWVLGAAPRRYQQSVRQLRAEFGSSAERWTKLRRDQLRERLAGPIFHGPNQAAREARARDNLQIELSAMEG